MSLKVNLVVARRQKQLQKRCLDAIVESSAIIMATRRKEREFDARLVRQFQLSKVWQKLTVNLRAMR